MSPFVNHKFDLALRVAVYSSIHFSRGDPSLVHAAITSTSGELYSAIPDGEL